MTAISKPANRPMPPFLKARLKNDAGRAMAAGWISGCRPNARGLVRLDPSDVVVGDAVRQGDRLFEPAAAWTRMLKTLSLAVTFTPTWPGRTGGVT